MRTASRPLTSKESEILKPRPRTGPVVAWLSNFLFLIILGVVPWAALFWAIGRFTRSIFIPLAGASIAIVPYVLWAARELIRDVARQRSNASYFRTRDELRARDRAAGVAEIRTCRVTDAIEVKEREDEGNHYFLRLDDDSVLFLTGQYLYNSDEKDEVRFPCTEFDLVVAPHSKVVFELVRRGSYLRPSKKLRAFTEAQYRARQVPKDLDLIQIPWDEIEAHYAPEILRAKGKRRRPS